MGYSLGPMLVKTLVMPGGSQTIMLALAATGTTFLALSAYVLKTRHNFSFMGGFFCWHGDCHFGGPGRSVFPNSGTGPGRLRGGRIVVSRFDPVRDRQDRQRRRRQLRAGNRGLVKASQCKRVQKAGCVDNTRRVAQFGGVFAKQTGLWHGTAPQACLMRKSYMKAVQD